MDKILAPAVNILEGMTHAIVKVVERKDKKTLPGITSEETSISIDSLSSTHRQFVLNLVNIEAKNAEDMMVEWNDTMKVEVTQPVNEVLNAVVSSGHTRLPVISDQKVIGLLHTKEFITYIGSGDSNWPSIVRPILRVQEQDDALKALKLMQEQRSHLSLVCQGEDVVGIITMEDIIEEIIGEISDEDDDGLMKRLLASRSRRPPRRR